MVIGALANAIPNPFGGFAPFPNTIMIPVMEAQSASIGYSFGLNYELGKRTIRAMTNEEFNGLTPDSLNNLNMERNTAVLGHLKSELPRFTEMMSQIIEQQVAIELKKAERTPSAMAEIITALVSGTSVQITDTIQSFTNDATTTEAALQTLSLISPFFALMGLISSQGGSSGGSPSTTLIRGTDISVFTSSDNIQFFTTVVYPLGTPGKDVEFNFDPSQKDTLMAGLNNIMLSLGDKYTQVWFNRSVDFFNGGVSTTNRTEAEDAIRFVNALQKWELLNAL